MARTKDGEMDIRASFASASVDNNSLFNMGLGAQSVHNTASTDRNLDVTDFFKNKEYHVDDVAAMPNPSVQAASVENVDTTALRGNCEAVKNDYVGDNGSIVGYCTKVAEQQFGVADGRKLMDQCTPGGGPTHKQAFITAVDPSGVGGALIGAATAIHAQMNRIMDNDVLAQFAEMLNKIEEAATQQHNQLIGVDQAPDTQLPPPPDGCDFTGVTPGELLAFLERDVNKDPVMQDIAKVELALDEYDRQMDYKVAHDHEVVTAEKVAVASVAELTEMAGGDTAVAEAAATYSAYAVDITREGLQEPALVQAEVGAQFIDQQFATAHEVRLGLSIDSKNNAAVVGYDREAELQKMAEAFKPSDNSMPI